MCLADEFVHANGSICTMSCPGGVLDGHFHGPGVWILLQRSRPSLPGLGTLRGISRPSLKLVSESRGGPYCFHRGRQLSNHLPPFVRLLGLGKLESLECGRLRS